MILRSWVGGLRNRLIYENHTLIQVNVNLVALKCLTGVVVLVTRVSFFRKAATRMSLTPDQYAMLERFAKRPRMMKSAWFLDLDGVALVEEHGNVFVSREVEQGIRDLDAQGWSVIINSARFPLSIIKSIASAWLSIYEADIPAVLLNGALIGSFKKQEDEVVFEEVAAFPLTRDEIEKLVLGIQEALGASISGGARDLAFFFYPRDWRKGEIVWVPEGTHIDSVRHKYRNASEIVSWSFSELRERMFEANICMAAQLIEKESDASTEQEPDALQSFQIRNPWDFFMTDGINKAAGSAIIAEKLKVCLADSAGAGDSKMDTFLAKVGLAVRVGHGKDMDQVKKEIPFWGIHETLDVDGPPDLGEAMRSLAVLLRVHSSSSSHHENHS